MAKGFFEEEDFASVEEDGAALKRQIINSFNFSRVFAFSVFKHQNKETSFTSGECAEKLKIDREAAWKYLERLTTEGFLKKTKKKNSCGKKQIYLTKDKLVEDEEFIKQVKQITSPAE